MSNGPSLLSLIAQRQAEGTLELPVFDHAAARVYQAVHSGEIAANELVALLEEDPVIAAEVLRAANSSFFFGLGEITRLRDAIVRLGNKQIAALVLAASQKRMYSASGGQFEDRLVQLWRHATAVAYGSRWLANETGLGNLADEAFLAGLLHDVGKMSLLRIIEDLIEKRGEELPVSDAVLDVAMRHLHPSHGATLLESWNLPEVFRRVVAEHHGPIPDRDDSVLLLVRLVDHACVKEGIGERHEPDIDLNTSEEALLLGLDEIRLAELQVVVEDAAQAA